MELVVKRRGEVRRRMASSTRVAALILENISVFQHIIVNRYHTYNYSMENTSRYSES
jgi:hypothetical protein